MGGLFSGLVKGFGSGMEQAYKRKADQEYQDKSMQRQLAASALMNDPNLTGAHRRAGLLAMGMPEQVVSQIVPDDQVENGQYNPEELPAQRSMPVLQGQNAILPPMPSSPLTGGRLDTSQMGQAPQQQNGMLPGGGGNQASGGGMLDQMPRNPLVDHPQIIDQQQENSTAPVTQKYTGGVGSKIDELDQKIAAAQESLRHGKPQMVSSLTMTRAQVDEARTGRLNREQQERTSQLSQVNQLMEQKRQLESYQAERAGAREDRINEPGDRLVGVQNALGRPLTGDEKSRSMGLGPQGPELQDQLEAKDIKDSQDNALPAPIRQAAQQRVLTRHLQIEHQIASIRNIQSETIKRMTDKSNGEDLTPAQVRTVIARSKMQAGGEFGTSEQDAYRTQRTDHWSKWFDEAAKGNAVPGSDPTTAQWLQQIQANKGADVKARAVASKVEEDLKSYKDNLGQAIANAYLSNPGKKVYTLHSIRRGAEQVKRNGGDANKFWDTIKDNKDIVILGDDLEPWTP